MIRKKAWIAGILLVSMLAGCTPPAEDTDANSDSSPVSHAASSDAAVSEPQEPVIPAPPADEQTFVRVCDYIPDILVDLRYATTNNFTGTVIYAYQEAWLRYATVRKLAAAQEQLKRKGTSCAFGMLFARRSHSKRCGTCIQMAIMLPIRPTAIRGIPAGIRWM